jgi:hypothetical protein
MDTAYVTLLDGILTVFNRQKAKGAGHKKARSWDAWRLGSDK